MLRSLVSASEKKRSRSNVISSTIGVVDAEIRFNTFHARNGLCHASSSEDARAAVNTSITDKIAMS